MTTVEQNRPVDDGLRPERARIPTANIDFLRGIAALYVVINHSRGNFFVGGEAILAKGDSTLLDKLAVAALQLTTLGTEFVVLFFVLSGFAMAHSVGTTRSRSRFYLKRVIRVWPTYLAALAFAVLVCLVVTALGTQSRLGRGCAADLCDIDRVAQIAVYIDVHTPLTQQFWSLPYEVIFYAMAPFILCTKDRILITFGVASIGMLISFFMFGIKFNPSNFAFNFLTQELFMFALGAFAYTSLDRIPKIEGWKFYFIIVAVFLSTIAVKKIYGGTNLVGNLMFSISTVILIRNLPDKFGFSRFNFGYFSYSIYVYHVAILGMLLAILQVVGFGDAVVSSYWGWIFALPPTVGICWILWWFSERPCIAALDRIRRSQASRA